MGADAWRSGTTLSLASTQPRAGADEGLQGAKTGVKMELVVTPRADTVDGAHMMNRVKLRVVEAV